MVVYPDLVRVYRYRRLLGGPLLNARGLRNWQRGGTGSCGLGHAYLDRCLASGGNPSPPALSSSPYRRLWPCTRRLSNFPCRDRNTRLPDVDRSILATLCMERSVADWTGGPTLLSSRGVLDGTQPR